MSKELDYVNEFLKPIDLLEKQKCECMVDYMTISSRGKSYSINPCLRCVTLTAIKNQCEKALKTQKIKSDEREKELRDIEDEKKRDKELEKKIKSKIKSELKKMPDENYINPEEKLRSSQNVQIAKGNKK